MMYEIDEKMLTRGLASWGGDGMERQQKIGNIVPDVSPIVKVADSKGIKVTIHIPGTMSEISRRRKINKIYDILKPEVSR